MLARILWVLGAVAVLAPAPARAEWGGYDRSGFYLGVGGLFTQNSLLEDLIADALPVSPDIDDSWGVSAQLGYRAFSFLAAELEYDYVSPYDLGAGGLDVLSIESHLFTANVKGILPIWRIQPYLLGGIGFVNWNIDDKLGFGLGSNSTELAGRAGGGIDLHLTSRISLNVGADVVFSKADLDTNIPGTSDVGYLAYVAVGAGLRYRFWGLSGE